MRVFESAACGKSSLRCECSWTAGNSSSERMETAENGVRKIQNSSNSLPFPHSNCHKMGAQQGRSGLMALGLERATDGNSGSNEIDGSDSKKIASRENRGGIDFAAADRGLRVRHCAACRRKRA